MASPRSQNHHTLHTHRLGHHASLCYRRAWMEADKLRTLCGATALDHPAPACGLHQGFLLASERGCFSEGFRTHRGQGVRNGAKGSGDLVPELPMSQEREQQLLPHPLPVGRLQNWGGGPTSPKGSGCWTWWPQSAPQGPHHEACSSIASSHVQFHGSETERQPVSDLQEEMQICH